MDIPRNDRPTPEMAFAAAVWVLLAFVIICFTNPEKAEEAQAKPAHAREAHGGSRVELR